MEARVEDDTGYFFSRLGEACLTAEPDLKALPCRATAPGSLLVCSSRHGITVFVDMKGVYISKTEVLVSQLRPWDDEAQPLPPLNRSSVCCASLIWENVRGLQLLEEANLLAAYDSSSVRVYSLQQLVNGKGSPPLAIMEAAHGSEVHQVQVHVIGDALHYLAVLSPSRQLMTGRVTDKAVLCKGQVLAESVQGACWAPQGPCLAYCRGADVVLCHIPSGSSWNYTVTSQRVDPASGEALLASTVDWMADSHLIVGAQVVDSSSVSEGHEALAAAPELNLGVLCYLQWGSWQPPNPPVQAQGCDVDLCNIDERAYSEHSSPYFVSARVPAWGLTLTAHVKAADEHVRLIACPGDGVVSIEISEDKCALRIPMAMDDEDNYVTGIGIDTSVANICPEHPTDATAAALPPQPVCLIMTSDGRVRGYALGDYKRSDSCVVVPTPVQPPPSQLLQALAAAVGAGEAGEKAPAALPVASVQSALSVGTAQSAAVAAAANAALPSDDDDGAEDKEISSTPQAQPKVNSTEVQDRARAAALPDSDEEEGDEGDDSQASSAASTPLRPPPASDTQQRPGGGEGVAAVPAAGPPSVRQAAPTPLFSFATSPDFVAAASAPSWKVPSAFSSTPTFGVPAPSVFGMPAIKPTGQDAGTDVMKALPASSGEMQPKDAAVKQVPPTKPKASSSQPPVPNRKLFAQAQALQAKYTAKPAASGAPAPQPAFSVPGAAFKTSQATAEPKANLTTSAFSAPQPIAVSSGTMLPAATPSLQAPSLSLGRQASQVLPIGTQGLQSQPPNGTLQARYEPQGPPKPNAAQPAVADAGSELTRVASQHDVAVAAEPPGVPEAEPRLADCGPEIAALEADFLSSLYEVRVMSSEFDCHMDNLYDDMDRQQEHAAAIEEIAGSIQELLKQMSVNKAKFAALQQNLLETTTRCGALEQLWGDTLKGFQSPNTAPLPTALSLLVGDAQRCLASLQERTADLCESVAALDLSKRSFSGAPSSRHLYAAVGHLSSVLASQTEAVRALGKRVEGLGLLDSDDEEAPDTDKDVLRLKMPHRMSPAAMATPQSSGKRTPGSASATWTSTRSTGKRFKVPGEYLVPKLTVEDTSSHSQVLWSGRTGTLLAEAVLLKASNGQGLRIHRPHASNVAGTPSEPDSHSNGRSDYASSTADQRVSRSVHTEASGMMQLGSRGRSVLDATATSAVKFEIPQRQAFPSTRLSEVSPSVPLPQAIRPAAAPLSKRMAGPAAATAPTTMSQAPVATPQLWPSGTQVQQQQGAGSTTARAPVAQSAAATPKPSAKQPPVPSRAQVVKAQELMQNLASPAASPAPLPRQPAPRSAQPPVPSRAMLQAAQKRFEAQTGGAGSTAPDKRTTAAASSTPAQTLQTGPATQSSKPLGTLAAFGSSALAVPANGNAATGTTAREQSPNPAVGSSAGQIPAFSGLAVPSSAVSSPAAEAPAFSGLAVPVASTGLGSVTSLPSGISSTMSAFGGSAAIGASVGASSPSGTVSSFGASPGSVGAFGLSNLGVTVSSTNASASSAAQSSAVSSQAQPFGAFGAASAAVPGVFSNTSLAGSTAAPSMGSGPAFPPAGSVSTFTPPAAAAPFGTAAGGGTAAPLPFTAFGAGSATAAAAPQSNSMFGSAGFGMASSTPGSGGAFGFGSLGLGASAAPSSSAATSVFGKGLAFGSTPKSAVASTTAPPFGAAGQTQTAAAPFGMSNTSSQASAPFGAPSQSHSQAGNLFSAPAAPSSTSAGFGGSTQSAFGAGSMPTFGTVTGAFGSSGSMFGSAATNSFSGSAATPAVGFGQNAAPQAPFGTPSTPAGAFGQPAVVGFGQQQRSPGFGQPASPAPMFGAAATPAPAFGHLSTPGSGAFGAGAAAFGSAAAGGNAFATAASSPSGFGAFAAAASQPAGFAAFATQAGQQGSSFGGSMFGAKPSSSNPSMWAARK